MKYLTLVLNAGKIINLLPNIRKPMLRFRSATGLQLPNTDYRISDAEYQPPATVKKNTGSRGFFYAFEMRTFEHVFAGSKIPVPYTPTVRSLADTCLQTGYSEEVKDGKTAPVHKKGSAFLPLTRSVSINCLPGANTGSVLIYTGIIPAGRAVEP